MDEQTSRGVLNQNSGWQRFAKGDFMVKAGFAIGHLDAHGAIDLHGRSYLWEWHWRYDEGTQQVNPVPSHWGFNLNTGGRAAAESRRDEALAAIEPVLRIWFAGNRERVRDWIAAQFDIEIERRKRAALDHENGARLERDAAAGLAERKERLTQLPLNGVSHA